MLFIISAGGFALAALLAALGRNVAMSSLFVTVAMLMVTVGLMVH